MLRRKPSLAHSTPLGLRIAVTCIAVTCIGAADAQNTPEVLVDRSPEAPFYSSDAIDFTGLSTYSRTTDEIVPVSLDARIAITSRWGLIRVNVWDNPVARITAKITVGSTDSDRARQHADRINIFTETANGGLEILTEYPEVDSVEQVGIQVDYELSVPRRAEVIIDNKWGDTAVKGLDGDLTLDTAFGVIELSDIGGYVRARASQYPLFARGLRGGATFTLSLVDAEFVDVEGSLSVVNQWGSVTLRDIRDFADLYVQSEDGPVHFYVEPGAHPNIEAVTHYGAIESDLPIDTYSLGQLTQGSITNTDATQRLVLSAAFAPVHIHHETPADAIEPLFVSRTSPITETITHTLPAPDGTPLIINATAGDIRIEGADDEQLHVTATRRANVNRDAAAKAIDALDVKVEQRGDTLHIDTRALEDMTALGCTDYGIDLTIRVPRSSPLRLTAQRGRTTVLDTGGRLDIQQATGDIIVEHAKGTLNIHNENGTITANDCAGPATIHGSGGSITIKTVYGEIDLTGNGGNTLIESPHGAVRVRHTTGDVRLLAPEGLHGEIDIDVRDGNISMAIPETTQASFWMTAEQGAVHPDFPVSGTKDRQKESFQGQLNNGTHRVLLKTLRGNIVLD